MASPTLKPEKKLVEFLKEKQEPFILDLYLLEKSKSWTSINNLPSNSSTLNKKQKPLFPFFKLLLTAIHDKNKNKKKKFASIKHSSNTTNKHANFVGHVFYEAKNNLDQTERFSTASSSTIFHSCSDIDDDDDDEEEEDRASFSSSHKHHNNPLFSLDTFQASRVCNNGIQSQQDTDNKKHHQRCIEVCVTHETWNKDVCGVIGPKKISENSLLSAALFSSLFQRSKRDQSFTKELQEILAHDVSHMVKSKNVLHKTKRLFFDCVRELTINLPEKDCKQFMGPEKLGKIIWERTKKWSERGCGNYETNLTNFLNLDYLDSINEWSEFKTEVKDVSVEIADAILECMMKDEIVSDMFEILSPNTQQT